ncbi:DNA polymerase I [Petrotoga sp. 9PWA.NaAc.5.4]|uniref:DNA polymerase I n=1 Tax=Petrotoga sp. 9PWA.NaAc.5.4 TaxID=1434328 RepID=UPI000CC25410|nr:DNA polymerase I [Petrotoga sp. 9PWA.NaAc.5.4]PNR92465.1 DNA polymerase I [Petrotoga sp. 9PWA.NaAc.5.4]
MGNLYLIDGSAIAYRAFFALGDWMSTSDGLPTNAIYGVARMLLKLLKDYVKKGEDSIIFVMDKKTSTYRNELLKSYKAQRPETPEKYIQQIPYIMELVEKLGIKFISMDNYEADDVIASIVVKKKENYDNIYIITSDKDMMQLVKENIYILRPEQGVTEIVKYDEKEVEKKMGVPPKKIADLLALMGDSSDNIPGVKGIGIKTAQKLLQDYECIEELYENIDKIKGSTQKKLIENKDNAVMSKKLVKLMLDAPIEKMYKDEEIVYRGYKEDLRELLRRLEFNSILKELDITQENSKKSTNLSTKEKRKDYSSKGKYELFTSKNYKELLKIIEENEIISFDIETTSLDPYKADIVGIALSVETFEGYFLDLYKDEKRWDIVNELIDILNNKKIVGQNLKYDISVLKVNGVELKKVYFDTMIAAYLLDPDSRRFNMDDLAKEYLDYKSTKYKELFGKDIKLLTLGDIEKQKVVDYAGEDADIAYRLFEVLKPKLEEFELLELFQKIEIPTINVLSEMEINGVYFDLKELKELEIEYNKKLDSLMAEMKKMVGYDFNPNSPKQVGELLFEHLGLKGKRKTKSGVYSTDADALESLKNEHPIVEKLLEYRKYQKLISTYIVAIPKLVNPKTGRVHTSFNQTGTATGRLSSSEPNLQNLPIREEEGERIRRTLKVQKEDFVLLSADYSQIELRVLAHITKDETLINAFINDEDIHSLTAAKIFGVDVKKVDSNMRRVGKVVNFSLIYGSSAYGLAENLGIPVEDAKTFIKKYFETYKKVQESQEESLKVAKSKGYVETIFGRKRFLNKIKTNQSELKRIVINTPIQGSAADIMKLAMIKLYETLDEQAKLILQVHDEVLIELPEKLVENTKKVVKDCMENVVKLEVPLKVDINVGKNWQK